jgi:hypothetical protein
MTDDKQDPSVVAWRFNDALNPSREPLFTDKPYVAEVWGSAHGTVTPLSLTSDLTAMKAELEEAKKALNEIACFTQTDKLLWWQERARAALSKPKPHDEGGLRSISEDGK